MVSKAWKQLRTSLLWTLSPQVLVHLCSLKDARDVSLLPHAFLACILTLFEDVQSIFFKFGQSWFLLSVTYAFAAMDLRLGFLLLTPPPSAYITNYDFYLILRLDPPLATILATLRGKARRFECCECIAPVT